MCVCVCVYACVLVYTEQALLPIHSRIVCSHAQYAHKEYQREERIQSSHEHPK